MQGCKVRCVAASVALQPAGAVLQLSSGNPAAAMNGMLYLATAVLPVLYRVQQGALFSSERALVLGAGLLVYSPYFHGLQVRLACPLVWQLGCAA